MIKDLIRETVLMQAGFFPEVEPEIYTGTEACSGICQDCHKCDMEE